MNKVIRFSKFGKVGLIISLLVTLSLIGVTIYNKGFNLGIEFQSGQTIDVFVNGTVDADLIKNALSTDFEQLQVSQVGNDTSNSFNIKIASTVSNQDEHLNKALALIEKEFGNVELKSTSFIGTGISQNLLRSIIILVSGAMGLILLYIWLRFKFAFAISAILSLFHDILFIVGIVGAFKIEVTTSTVAAILTIIGYSLNDTIVIFDRIRENTLLIREGNFATISDISITKTLSRTLITSFTTLLAMVALLLFATGDIYYFALVLIIGIVEGTWSSIFIATPLVSLSNTEKLLAKFRKNQGGGIQYKTDVNPSTTTQQISESSKAASNISNKELEKIKAEIHARQDKKKKQRKK